MKEGGAKIWYFPDGYLPEKTGEGELEPHEALMLLNAGTKAAHVKLDLYFDNKDPVKDITVSVEAERIRCLRMDHAEEIGGVHIPPLTQYAVRVRSDVNIVAMFGRLDTTQANLALYGCMGYHENG